MQITLTGRLDMERVGELWGRLSRQLDKTAPQYVDIDASRLEYCDSSGIALIHHIQTRQRHQGGECRLSGLNERYQTLLALFDPRSLDMPQKRSHSFSRIAEDLGRTAVALYHDLCDQIRFVGQTSDTWFKTCLRPGTLRWRETLVVAERSGADALGITALLGFLIGLILAFQAAVAMKQFGAEVFVADLVVISLFRELGPLITAFILASRSGSAFAAEIGTMKVNEEIDALTTMGLDPVRFLVLPRMTAGVVVLPLLTLLNLLFGLLGCALVMLALGYPLVTFTERIQTASGLGDLFGGLAKTLVFGLLVSGVGCLRGFQTRTGAGAVGQAATRAVVSGIVAIIVADGVFAVLYYFLGI